MWLKIVSPKSFGFANLFALHSRGLAFCSRNLLPGRGMCTATVKNDAGPVESPRETIGVPAPPEPNQCCNLGCPNCVWIKYAQEMTQLYDNGDVIAKNKILERVKDPKLRAFLLTSLGLNEKKT